MHLGVILTYRAAELPDGSVVASDKYLAEMRAYAERWPGDVDVFVATTSASDEVLGSSPLPRREANLIFHPVPEDRFGFEIIDPLPDVLLTAVDAPLHVIPKRCRNLPTATVVAIEYTFKTRNQVLLSERSDLRGRAGALKWNLGQEARIVAAARNADAIQANGYPAFETYRKLNKAALLYLDSRAYESEMPTLDHVKRRVRAQAPGPVRLAFTGRLEARKGPLETVAVARELSRRGVEFTFLVAGDGPLRGELEAAVAQAGLSQRFEITGVLDFDEELMPRIRNNVDVFFCPHPQGDPSCTYVETLAGGVPIVGYDNESVAALARHTVGVQSVPMGDVAAAAEAIAVLTSSPAELVRRSTAALSFARAHSFERTYDARVKHLISVAG